MRVQVIISICILSCPSQCISPRRIHRIVSWFDYLRSLHRAAAGSLILSSSVRGIAGTIGVSTETSLDVFVFSYLGLIGACAF